IVRDAPSVTLRDRYRVIDEILQVGGRREIARHLGRLRPVWRGAEPREDLHAVLLGEVHDRIVLVPRADRVRLAVAVEVIAAILKIALAMDLDVFPGKLLADPAEPGLADQA